MTESDIVVSRDTTHDRLCQRGHRNSEDAADDAARNDECSATQTREVAERRTHRRHPKERLSRQKDVFPTCEPRNENVNDEDCKKRKRSGCQGQVRSSPVR